MELKFEKENDIKSWEEVVLIYNSALKEVGTKLEILNDEFQHVHQYNPIEHIKSRIKTPQSIVKKLKKHHYESTIANMVEYVNDIAGIRITCSFFTEVYFLADMLARQDNLSVIHIKDYIGHPKESGYKSYHMLLSIQVALADAVIPTKVEVQIRTMAMDFWASLEHKIYYKYEGNAPGYFARELQECASIISRLDAKMMSLNEAMKRIDGE